MPIFEDFSTTRNGKPSQNTGRRSLQHLLGLNEQGATGVVHHPLGTAILDLKCLYGEQENTVGQIPSIGHVSAGISHGHLVEWRKWSRRTLRAVKRRQKPSKVAPLWFKGFIVKRKLPTLASFEETEQKLTLLVKLAGKFVAKAIQFGSATDQAFFLFFMNFTKFRCFQFFQYDLTRISFPKICKN